MQHLYIIRPYDWRHRHPGWRYVQVEEFNAESPEINRPTGKTLDLGELGRARFVERTGKRDTSRLTIRAGAHWTRREYDGISAEGNPTSADGWSHTVANTAKGVKEAIRRLRPQDAGALDETDAVIADLRQRLRDTQDQRAELMAMAWQRAHVVTLAEAHANPPRTAPKEEPGEWHPEAIGRTA